MGDDGAVAGKRGNQTVRDMVLSMAVIVAVSAGIYVVVPHDESKNPVKTVDYQVELASARRAAPYPVLAPQGLDRGWRATSVTYDGAGQDGAQWHLGFLAPKEQYVAVEQSDGRPAAFISSVTKRAEPVGGAVKAGGDKWERYEGETYRALVREQKGVTTVVTGTASYERLAEMAAALRAS